MSRVELEGRKYGSLPPQGWTHPFYEESIQGGFNLANPPKTPIWIEAVLPEGVQVSDFDQDQRKGYLNGIGQRLKTHVEKRKDEISAQQRETVLWALQIIGWKAALQDEFMDGVMQGNQSRGAQRKLLEEELLSSGEKMTVIEKNRADGFRLGRIIQSLRENNSILSPTMGKLPRKVSERKRLQ